MTVKRTNKTKEQIVKNMAAEEKNKKYAELAKRIYPLLKVETIYDAQTTFQALSGYFKDDLLKKEKSFKVSDLTVNLADQPKGLIVDSMEEIRKSLEGEEALLCAEFLEIFATVISQYGLKEFTKKPLSDLKLDDLVK